jgi:hypothetical protein
VIATLLRAKEHENIEYSYTRIAEILNTFEKEKRVFAAGGKKYWTKPGDAL